MEDRPLGSTVIQPFRKSARSVPSVRTTSLVGYPSGPFSHPVPAQTFRMRTVRTRAPVAGDQYTDPPWK
jgi:hypothetical protein